MKLLIVVITAVGLLANPGFDAALNWKRLRLQAEETAAAFIAGLIGSEQKVLAEEERDGYVEGYTDNYVKIYIKADTVPVQMGDFCEVKLVEPFREGILAVPV